MLIAQMTDIHIGFDPEAKPEELNRIRFRQTLARLLKAPNEPDMLILTGDLTDRGDRDSFEKIAAALEEIPWPIHPLMGNHDSREEMLRVFPNCPTMEGGFLQYTIEQDGLLIVMLDTFEEGRHGGAFCEKRAAWLKEVLAANADTPTVIFMHHPPVISGIGWMDPGADEPWMLRLAEVMTDQPQIHAIHCGHLHRPINTRFCGIPLSVTPSVAPLVSMDLREISPDTPDSRALITTEPPTYAMHLWDGKTLVSHYEKVSDWDVLANYGPHLQPMIREMFSERE